MGRSASALASIACAIGVIGATACGSFGAAPDAEPGPDAGDAANAGNDAGPPETCDEPTFVDDPAAKPDAVCDGVAVDLATDPSHCGACDHACGGCAQGLCPKDSVEGVTNAAVATVAGSALYVATKAGAVEKAGGPEFSPALGGTPVRLGADATSLWAATSTKLIRYDVAGAVGDLVSGVTSSRFVVGESAIFYADSARVVKLPKDGGPTSAVDAAGIGAVATSGDDAYWTALPAAGKGVAVVGPFGAPKELATATQIDTLTVDDAYVTFADATTNEIRRVRRTGGSTQRVARDPVGTVERLHQDGAYLYWASHRGNHYALVRARKCGGVPLVVIDDAGELTQISTDARFVYAAEPLSGLVLRAPK